MFEDERPRGADAEAVLAVATQTVTVLAAEDDPHDQMLLVMAAKDCTSGIEMVIEFVNDGVELLEELRRREVAPDLVILDMRMPRLGGHEVLETMKSDPSIPEVEVVVFSSSYRPQDVERSLNNGALWYEVKPSKYEDLVAFVDRVAKRLVYGES